MAHTRKTIRDAIVTALTNATSAATRVYSGRSISLDEVPRPNIVVYTRSEEGQIAGQASSPTQRKLTVVVEGRVEGGEGSNLDNLMDALAEAIETKMNLDQTFSGNAIRSFLSGTTLDTSSESEKLTGLVSMTYEFEYIF